MSTSTQTSALQSRVELHCHTHYSLMDGLNTADEYVQVAKSFDMPAIAITDHGTLSGHRDMQDACREGGIKPILGVEAYISPTDRFDRRSIAKRDDNTQAYNHIILLAKNAAGLKNLHNMSREAWQSGFYSKPRIDWELLDQYGDDIIVLSGCMNGLIPKAFERGEEDHAIELARKYFERFGDDFYLEVQAHNPPALNNFLYTLSAISGIKTVATTDCHFTRPELRWVEDAMLILSTSPKQDRNATYANTKGIEDIFERFEALYPERKMTFEDIDVYLQSRDELERAFAETVSSDLYTESIETTLEVADKIGEYDYIKNENFLPEISTDPDAELSRKVQAGLVSMGLTGDVYKERAQEELRILKSKKFAPYFLIVADMVDWARKQDIFVGPGRGSAAGSLVCYALGITDVDPIEYDLLFFRFIDEARDDWPDIDLDFEKERRGEVKEYVRQKYGHVASISNFIYFKDKGVIRDAARVFAVPIVDVNKALKPVDNWDDFIDSNIEEVASFRKRYPEVIELAEHLRGRIRSVGMHAAGVVTSNKPIEDFAPFETRTDPNDKVSGRLPVVAWDMKQCADVGLIKLDILGIQTLDVIHDALRFIEARHQDVPNLRKLPLDDPRVFKEYAAGHTSGVFQADAQAYRSLLMEMGVDSFEDLVASTSLVRPGARNTVGESFIARKQGREQVTYVHEMMEPILNNTYGTIVYQEQLMLAATELGGMSKSEANKLRSIIGKKKDPAEFAQYKDRFMVGATQHISKAKAEQLWHDFEAHAGYSFNRSHAVAYSKLSYWTMWLKLFYPVEYMTARFRHEGNKEKRVELLIEMRRLGIKVRLPHLLHSQGQAHIEEDGGVRLGLTDIKYISDGVYRKLRQALPVSSYKELTDKASVKGSGISTRTLGALNAIGAAEFPDNPKRGDEQDNYYEYLNVPRFAGRDLPLAVLETLTPLEDYDEEATLIVKAMVKSIKRGTTKLGKPWIRVEMIDETGVAGIFNDPNADVPEPGQMYVFLVTHNQIMKAVPIDDFGPENDDPFVRFMYNEGKRAGVGEMEVLAVERRFTKRRQMMATLVGANSKREMRRIMVFPATFGSVAGKLRSGAILRPKMKKLDDGSLMLQELS